MEPTKSDIYAYQLLNFLVSKHQYQIVTIKQQRQDIWLMNSQQEHFPVIRLSALSNSDTLSDTEYLRNAHRAILDIIHRESKLLILNTHEDSSSIDNEFFTQVPFFPGNIEFNIQVMDSFPGIQDVIKPVENTQEEYVKLTRSLEEAQIKMVKNQRKNMNIIKMIPKMTGIIAIVCIAYFLVITMVSGYVGNSTVGAILSGAYYKMNVISMNEYWRLLTSGFMHASILHLLMNLMALVNVGIACEKIFKRSQYIIILLLSIIGGNLFVFIAQGNSIGMGISGGVFGLLGAFIACLYENGSIKHPMVKATVMRLLTINLLISILPGISLLAHLGGFICGVFMGIIFVPSQRWINLKKHVTLCFAFMLTTLGLYSLTLKIVEPLDVNLDKALIVTVRNLGMDWYADKMQESYLQFYTKDMLQEVE